MGTAWTDDVHQHRVYAANLKNDVGKNDAGSHLDIIVQTDVLEVAFCNECVMCSFCGKSLFHEVTPIQTEDIRETLRQCGLNPTDISLCYPSHGTGKYISSFITFSTPERYLSTMKHLYGQL